MARRSLRHRAMGGETLLGSMIFEFFSPGIAQVHKLAGCEYLIYDMEHAGFSIEQLKEQCAYCRGIGITPMVRVPRGEYHFLARALDVGAHGVMVPMVDSVEQARAIAEATHYPPKGRRGAAFGFAHDDYEPGDPAAKMKAADAVLAKRYKAYGFKMIATGTDHGILMAGVRDILSAVAE